MLYIHINTIRGSVQAWQKIRIRHAIYRPPETGHWASRGSCQPCYYHARYLREVSSQRTSYGPPLRISTLHSRACLHIRIRLSLVMHLLWQPFMAFVGIKVTTVKMFMRLNCAWWELGSSRMWQMMVKNRGIRKSGNWWWEGDTMMNWPIIRAGGVLFI